jgi:hypothetical protein
VKPVRGNEKEWRGTVIGDIKDKWRMEMERSRDK